MLTWLEKCDLSLHEVERCIELATLMEKCSGTERRLVEARLLGMIEGLGFGWRKGIVGVAHVHVCEIIGIPWKFVDGRIVWGNDALDNHDLHRDNSEKAKDLCETDTDLAAVLREVKDNEVVDQDLVMRLKRERKERENRRRYPFK